MLNQIPKIVIALALCVCTCVSPYDIRINNTLQILTVDGTLTDEGTEQKFQIVESNFSKDALYKTPIPNLTVELLVNRKDKIRLIEQKDGFYALPGTFRTKNGDTYQLLFQKSDGTKYESSEEIMRAVPKIDTIYDEFVTAGILRGENRIPTNNIYIDYTDTPNERNYYVFSWTLWERQYVCTSTDYYDLYCNQECWEILYNDNIDIFSDVYTNGKHIEKKLAAEIPYYQTNGALIEIKQQRISFSGYQFLKLLKDQLQNTGTLVDTPPEALVGNIRNLTNPNEEVAGVFMVASVASTSYWISRDNANANGKVGPIGLLGRKPVTSPVSVTVPCIASRTRTPIKPKGWMP